MITQYGYDVFFTVAILCLVVIAGSWFLLDSTALKAFLIALSLLAFGFTLYFFRDPPRVTPSGSELVIAPADGKVIAVRDTVEPEYIGGDATMISIFMSPLDVHVNRMPASGRIGFYRYVKGEYFAAFEDKASLRNEQTHIGVETNGTKLLFKQIAGFIARRIVCTVGVGDSVQAGARFGMIKFGSRVDLFVPRGSTIGVRVNERTVAGETVVATLPVRKGGKGT